MLACALATLMPAAVPTSAHAGQVRFAPGEQAITVTPVVSEREVDQGEQLDVEITVLNQTERDFAFTARIADIAPPDDPFDDKQVIEAGGTPRGASSWARLDSERFTLRAGEIRRLRMRVEVPEDAASGGHYAAVIVRALPSAQQGIAISTDISSLLLLRVRGDIRHDLRVRVVPTRQWWWKGPVHWRVEVDNRGNVHEFLAGYATVDGALGSSYRRRFRGAIVLPGSRRHLPVTTAVRSAPDLLRARARYVVDTNGDGAADERDSLRTATAGPRAVVMPWWVLAALAIAILAIVWRIRSQRPHTAEWAADDGEIDTAGHE